jgi:hypothetical protein
MIVTTTPQAPVKIISNHGFAEIVENLETKQKALFTTRSFRKGEVISAFGGSLVFTRPNYLTVQTGIEKHIALNPEFLQYINHSCDPNVFFDTSSFELVALRDIDSNEELGFFYPSTEWEMDQPFSCYCGSDGCLQTIRGARFLDATAVKKYRLTDFIREQLKKK